MTFYKNIHNMNKNYIQFIKIKILLHIYYPQCLQDLMAEYYQKLICLNYTKNYTKNFSRNTKNTTSSSIPSNSMLSKYRDYFFI